MESLKRPSKLIFVVLNFVTEPVQGRGTAAQAMMYLIHVRSISLTIFLVTKPYLQRLGQIA